MLLSARNHPQPVTDATEKPRADVRRARAYGANGVSFFVVDERYGISGAQPVEIFRDVLARADADADGIDRRAPL